MLLGGEDYFALIGKRLSERVAAIWEKLTEKERDAFRRCTREDDFRALLKEHEGTA